MTAPARLHHLALTVTDIERSVRWYEEVFDIRFRMDLPHRGGVGKLLADDGRHLVIVLHRHDRNDGSLFSESVAGLDHVGFTVADRPALVDSQHHLEAHGVVPAEPADKPLTQSPIADAPYGSVLVFRDPDNIQLELVAHSPR